MAVAESGQGRPLSLAAAAAWDVVQMASTLVYEVPGKVVLVVLGIVVGL